MKKRIIPVICAACIMLSACSGKPKTSVEGYTQAMTLTSIEMDPAVSEEYSDPQLDDTTSQIAASIEKLNIRLANSVFASYKNGVDGQSKLIRYYVFETETTGRLVEMDMSVSHDFTYILSLDSIKMTFNDSSIIIRSYEINDESITFIDAENKEEHLVYMPDLNPRTFGKETENSSDIDYTEYLKETCWRSDKDVLVFNETGSINRASLENEEIKNEPSLAEINGSKMTFLEKTHTFTISENGSTLTLDNDLTYIRVYPPYDIEELLKQPPAETTVTTTAAETTVTTTTAETTTTTVETTVTTTTAAETTTTTAATTAAAETTVTTTTAETTTADTTTTEETTEDTEVPDEIDMEIPEGT